MVRLAVYTDYAYRSQGTAVYGERAFVLFLASLADHVESLTVIGRLNPRPGISHYRLPDGIRFVGLPHYETLRRPHEAAASMVRSLGRFWRALDDVDAVWLMGPYLHSLAFVPLARLRGRRVVLGVRQDLPALTRARTSRRWLHHAADVLEAVWKLYALFLPVVAVGPELAAKYRHSPAVLPMVVSLVSERDLGAVPRHWDGPRRVLSVGRIDREKNPLLLAQVLADLRAGGGDWRLVVCGEGPMTDGLRERLRCLGMSDHAELRGYLPLHELLDVYRSAHAFLHVALSEGLPQVLFEAFATGLPVVATAVGGVAEAVGDAALLIPPGKADPAVAALERLALEPALREQLVAGGLRRAQKHTLEAESARVAAFLVPH